MDPSILIEKLIDLNEDAFPNWAQKNRNQFDDELLAIGKTRVEEIGWQEDLPKALKILERLMLVAKMMANPASEALIWRTQANVLNMHEKYEESIVVADKAAAIYEQHSTPYMVAMARTVNITNLGSLGQFEEAIELSYWIHAVFSKENFTFGQARVLASLAQVLTWAWQLEEALDISRQARALYLKEGDTVGAAWVLHNMGVLANQMDQLDISREYIEDALGIFIENDEIKMYTKASFNLAEIYIREGAYDLALKHLKIAKQQIDNQSMSEDHAFIALYCAQVEHKLNNSENANRLYEEALDIFDELGYPLTSCETLILYGRFLSESNNNEKLASGIALFEKAEEILNSYDIPQFVAWLKLEKAELLIRLSRNYEAVEQLKWAREIFSESQLIIRESQAKILLAICYSKFDKELAYSFYQSVLEETAVKSPLLQFSCLFGLGQLLSENSPKLALNHFVEAFEIIKSLAHSFEEFVQISGFLASKQEFLQYLLEAVHNLNQESSLELLMWVERLKAITLSDMLIDQPQDFSSPNSFQQLLSIRKDLLGNLDRHMEALHSPYDISKSDWSKTATSIHAHDNYQLKTIAMLNGELLSLNQQLESWPDPAFRWREGILLQDNELQNNLSKDNLIASYYAIHGKLFVIILSHEIHSSVVIPLDVSLDEIDKVWRLTKPDLLSPKEASEDLKYRLASLWEKLIEPFEHHLMHKKRLIIIPYKSLYHIPFGCLYDKNDDEYLIQKCEIQYAPSLSILDWCKRQAVQNNHALVIGYPGEIDDHHYLPGVGTEIDSISNFLPSSSRLFGNDATFDNIINQAPGYCLIHFAGHASYEQSNPLNSGLHLAQDRKLRASDLFVRFRYLNGATVVLSGCDTGRGQITGNDILGLNTAFMYAGATGVVSGLWKIDDRTTANLMTRFYSHLNVGFEVTVALRKAQLELLEEAITSHPYYWGAFSLMGASKVYFR